MGIYSPFIKLNDMMTRRGIYYKLSESSYFVVIDGIKYYFSSKSYMNNFYKSYMNNRFEMKEKFIKRYGINAEINKLYDIVYYGKIEKRGFYLEYEGKCFECLEEINLYLEGKISKS